MDIASRSRRELAEFLKSRRAKVTPAQVGFPEGMRRRVSGLRREEVALLAGVSQTWYAYLEQGRDVHPSIEVLESLARVLALTEDERRYLHVLARGRRGAARRLIGDLSAREMVRQLVGTAHDSPYPVYGVDAYCDLIAWNPATTTYYGDFGALPANEQNMMHWLFGPQAKERLSEWETDAQDVVARWRGAAGGLTGDPVFDARVAEFRELSPDFTRWWDSHDVQQNRSRSRHFRIPGVGDRIMRLIVVQAPEFTPAVVVFHAPLDPELPASRSPFTVGADVDQHADHEAGHDRETTEHRQPGTLE